MVSDEQKQQIKQIFTDAVTPGCKHNVYHDCEESLDCIECAIKRLARIGIRLVVDE